MASGREQKIRAAKNAQYQQKVRLNRAFAELQNQEQPQPQPTSATVADGDTLETIASNYNTSVSDILRSNPDLKNVRTGMVVNLPPATFLGGGNNFSNNTLLPKDQNFQGGLGLPSNAAYGDTTNNVQGWNAYRQGERESATPQTFQQQMKSWFGPTPSYLNQRGAYGQNANTAIPQKPGYIQPRGMFGQTPSPTAYNNPVMGANGRPIGRYGTFGQQLDLSTPAQQAPSSNGAFNQAISAMVNRTPGAPASNTQSSTAQDKPVTNSNTPPAGFYMSQYQYFSRNLFHNQLRTKVETQGYVPTPGEVQILEKMGFVKRDPTSSGGGGYSWSKRRGGGGGGGRGRGFGRGGGGGGVPRQPAFSSGNGGFGLINWRI